MPNKKYPKSPPKPERVVYKQLKFELLETPGNVFKFVIPDEA